MHGTVLIGNIGCFSGKDYGLYLTATIGSAALLALAISSTVFIIVTFILIRGKTRAQRDLKLARETTVTKEMTTVDYEEVDLNQQAELAPCIISTRDNIAYDHVPKN